jgi:hypothetical protein
VRVSNATWRVTARSRRKPGSGTARQARFVAEYLIDLNATQAAIRAGYSKQTARQQASDLLSKPDIATAIVAGKAKQLGKANLTAVSVLEELRRLAFSDVRRLFDLLDPDSSLCDCVVHNVQLIHRQGGPMRHVRFAYAAGMALLVCATSAHGQAVTQSAAVPRLVTLSGTFRPADGRRAAPVETVTLAIYADQVGGSPLWEETQTITIGGGGQFTVILGQTEPDGIPLAVFVSGDARWLGMLWARPGEVEGPRTRITSVPYALRASDADTLGGRPASAYLLVDAPAGAATQAAGARTTTATTGGASFSTAGTPGYLGMFTDSVNLGNSVAYQSGARIGVGTAAPADYLHIAFNDSFGAFTGLAVQNLNGGPNAASGMLFYDQNGALAQFQGFNNANHAYVINNIASGGIIKFRTGGIDGFVLDGTGHVGMGGVGPNVCCGLFVSEATNAAVLGISSSNRGVEGDSTSSFGVIGFSTSGSAAVAGQSQGSALAGLFNGNVTITGTLSKGGGSFKIDHPLDPENKYLSHSFVESPDMKNVYDGNVVLDAKGEATVTLPDWFEALNKDFRYQLTALGAPGPNLYVADEIADHQFRIAGGTPGGKVSWMVTGIRQDAWANQNRIPVEQEKPADERGRYLYPVAFGLPLDKGITAVK